jgi:hypothetical protein
MGEPETTPEKAKRLMDLKKSGKRPLILALLRVDKDHGFAAERDMMRRLLAAGHPLINTEVLRTPKLPATSRTEKWRRLSRDRNRVWRESQRQDPAKHAAYLAAAAERKARRKKSVALLVADIPPLVRPNAILATYRGEVRTIAAWCEELGISRETVRRRIKRGLSPHLWFDAPYSLPRSDKGRRGGASAQGVTGWRFCNTFTDDTILH